MYIHRSNYETMFCSSNTRIGENLILSVEKLTDDAEMVKLSSIKQKCYINGYGQYNPNKNIKIPN